MPAQRCRLDLLNLGAARKEYLRPRGLSYLDALFTAHSLISFTFTGCFRVGARSCGRADSSLNSGLRPASRSFVHGIQIGTPFEKR